MHLKPVKINGVMACSLGKIDQMVERMPVRRVKFVMPDNVWGKRAYQNIRLVSSQPCYVVYRIALTCHGL